MGNSRRFLPVLAAILGVAAATTAEPAYRSPVALAATEDGKQILVAEATGNRITVIALASGEVSKTAALTEEQVADLAAYVRSL